MKIYCLQIVIFLMFPFIAHSQNDAIVIYKKSQNQRFSPIIKYELAEETILKSSDDRLRTEALRDIVTQSRHIGRDQSLLLLIDQILPRISPSSQFYGPVHFAKARLLMRLGNKKDAMTLFKQGIHEKWNGNAFHEINESYMETGQSDMLAVDEYERNVSDEYSQDICDYYGIGDDLSVFFIRLYKYKQQNPLGMAINDIYSQLSDSLKRPFSKQAAKVLCLAIDGLYSEAKIEISELEKIIVKKNGKSSPKDEWYHLPFYKTILYMYEGENFDMARLAFQEYIARNSSDPNRIINRTLDFIYTLDDNESFYPRFFVLTNILLKSDLITNDKKKSLLPINKLASLYDMHQQSLAWRGEYDVSASICRFVMDNFPMNELAVENCAMNWARYISWHDGKIDEAEQICLSILENTIHEEIVPWIKLCLAEISMKKQDTETALKHIDDVLTNIHADSSGKLKNCRKAVMQLKNQLNEP